jgi:hypothetical protein
MCAVTGGWASDSVGLKATAMLLLAWRLDQLRCYCSCKQTTCRKDNHKYYSTIELASTPKSIPITANTGMQYSIQPQWY